MNSKGGDLSIRDVSVVFDSVTALDRVSLDIQPGEAVALVGLSGAGKTTLLNTCNAMTWPTSGNISIDGKNLSSMDTNELKMARLRIGFVHQQLSLVPNLRVIQNVVIGRLGHRSLIGSARDLLFLHEKLPSTYTTFCKASVSPRRFTNERINSLAANSSA